MLSFSVLQISDNTSNLAGKLQLFSALAFPADQHTTKLQVRKAF